MSRGRLALQLITLAFAWLVMPACFAAGVLSGGVQQDVYLAPGSSSGFVVADDSGQPVGGATVSVPDLGIRTQTGPDGSFSFHGLPVGRRLILNVSKPGYRPENAILETDPSLNRPLRVAIEKSGGVLIIDDGLHHLGDNNYSPYSAAAGQFRKQAVGPVLVRRFRLNGMQPGPRPVLQVGVVMGLDTLQAHMAGQSNANAASSPVIVRLNGHDIAYITVNGLRQQIPVPPGLLRPHGDNLLEVKTGYHLPDGVRIDYDDMELMNLILIL